MSLSRGISSDTSFRLCTRAPRTAIVVRATVLGAALARVLPFIGRFSQVEKRQLLDVDVALLRQPDGRRGLADEALVGEVLAGRGHAAQAEIPLEMVLDLRAGPGLAHLTQVFEYRFKQGGGPLGDV